MAGLGGGFGVWYWLMVMVADGISDGIPDGGCTNSAVGNQLRYLGNISVPHWFGVPQNGNMDISVPHWFGVQWHYL